MTITRIIITSIPKLLTRPTPTSQPVTVVRSNPLDVVAIVGQSRTTYRKMVQNLW
jgi:ribosomal protein L3